jgi:hypothetical protein
MNEKGSHLGAHHSSLITPRFFTAFAVIGLLSCYVALGLSASAQKSQTGDEGIHLAGGVSFWATGDYRVQPASGNWPQHWCGLPIWLAGYQLPSLDDPAWRELSEWRYTENFCYQSGNDIDRMLLLGRMAASVFAALLAIIVYFWSRALFGPAAGLLSLALFVFSPTMLANGFLILADMASALFFTAAIGALWMLLHRVSLGTLLLSWFTLSGVFLAKFSGPMIVPMGLALVAVRMMNPAPVIVGQKREVRGRVAQLALFGGLVLILVLGVALSIWGSFGFRYSLLNPAVGPASQEINWNVTRTRSERVNRAIDFAREHHLLPEAYLYGLGHTLHTADERAAFLNGEFRQRGWISFFPFCLLYKTPLEFFVVLALGVAALIFYRRPTSRALYHLSPLLVLFVVYWAFSLTSHLNIGHRHLLPTYPAMMILSGAAVWWFKGPRGSGNVIAMDAPPETTNRGPAVFAARAAVAASLVGLVVECCWIWPDYLAYFNVVAGGPRHGYRHLGDSSLDWSQDLKPLGHWLDRHPDDARDPDRLYFAFFGGVPIEHYGIHARRLPSFPDRWQPHVPEDLTGGTYLISATMLQCFQLSPPGRWNVGYEASYQDARRDVATFQRLNENATGRQQLESIAPMDDWYKLFHLYERLRFSRLASYLRSREPDDEIGYSILVYRLSDEDLAQALEGPPVENLAEPEWETENRRYTPSAPDQ